MNAKDLLSNLEVVARKTQDRGYDADGINVHYIARDCIETIKELQAKLDEIERLCLDAMVERGDAYDKNFAWGYNLALERVMQILKGAQE